MSRTILLADDSVTIQKVIELTFMEEDYEVVAAGDGDEALERLDELRPDFVIADVHMPGASGIDVCRRAKQLYPDVPVLLLVGTFEPFDEDEARAAGADAHLKKPFDSQELLQLVDDLMGPEETVSPAAAPAVTAEPQDADSTWGFDVAGEAEERSAEPEAAAPAEEPEWAVPAEEPEWTVSPAPASTEPEAEWASPVPEEPAWAAPAHEEPEWAGESPVAAGGSESEPVAGEPEWAPADRQPAEVTPPAVGQAEVEEPAWGRPYPGESEPEGAREPFQLGEVEPRRGGQEEVFDLGTGEDESADAGAGGGYGADRGWGFAVDGGAQSGPAPGAAGEAEPGEGGEAGHEVAAAGFQWDEAEEPGSLVQPPDEPYPAVAEEPSWGGTSWGAPEEAAPAEPEPEPEATAEVPSWGEPGEAEELPWEPAVAAEPAAAEPAAAEAVAAEAVAAEAVAAEPAAAAPAAEPEAAEAGPAAPPVDGSGVSYGSAEVVPPPAAEPLAPVGAGSLSDGDVERIARRVAELVGERVTREVAWEVVPDLAEVVIRERLRELEGQLD